MKKDSFDDVMFYLSRVVLIIPIATILIGSVIYAKNRVDGLRAGSVQQKEAVTPAFLPSSTSSQQFSKQSSNQEVKLDLKGPFVCNYSSPDATISAYIKDKSVLFRRNEKNKDANYLLKGDCLYTWKEDYSGTKTCELGQFVSMIEMFSSFGFLNVSNILGSLSKAGLNNSDMPSESLINDVLNTCKKKEIEDEKFEVPKQILFKNGNLFYLTPSPKIRP